MSIFPEGICDYDDLDTAVEKAESYMAPWICERARRTGAENPIEESSRIDEKAETSGGTKVHLWTEIFYSVRDRKNSPSKVIRNDRRKYKSVFITERASGQNISPVKQWENCSSVRASTCTGSHAAAPASAASARVILSGTIPEPTSKDKKIFSEEELTLKFQARLPDKGIRRHEGNYPCPGLKASKSWTLGKTVPIIVPRPAAATMAAA